MTEAEKSKAEKDQLVQDVKFAVSKVVTIIALIGMVAGITAAVLSYQSKDSSQDASKAAASAAAASAAVRQSDEDASCRAEYAAYRFDAGTRLTDAVATNDRILNASWRAFIAKDEASLKASAPPLKEIVGIIDRRNDAANAADDLYQNLLSAQREDPQLFAAMCKTGPPS